ncbi:MAG: agmatine/peptidylarginine deiminase [Paracoccaceae bacterium]
MIVTEHSASTGITPKDAGFHMPAEWEHHERTWMMWPSRRGVWPDFHRTKRAYAAVARAIGEFEPVTVAACPADVDEARRMLGPAIDVIGIPIDDSWSRDAGPCFLVDGRGGLAGANFTFNAWGGKYRPYDSDNAFSQAVLAHLGARGFTSRLVAEGGGISVDGEGTVLTTESCFPNANRNPDWTRDQIEAELMAMLGAEKVIWLPGDAAETETDGHVDGIAVFVKPGVVLIEDVGRPGNWAHEVMPENIAALRGETDARGRPIELVFIGEAADAPSDSALFCRSYVNFYFTNGGLVMPCYGTASDSAAYEVFRELFPDRRIVQLPVNDIAVGGGGIHCITQQQPAKVSGRRGTATEARA